MLPPPCPGALPGGSEGAGSGKGRRSSSRPSNIPEPLKLCAPPIETRGGGLEDSPGWRAHSRDAGRVLCVTRSGDEDRERERLRPRGGSRTGCEATAGPAPLAVRAVLSTRLKAFNVLAALATGGLGDLARQFPLAGAERARRAASTLPARSTYRSRLGCDPPPPPGTHGGGGGVRAPPGVARTRALPGALVASRAVVRGITSGGVCALGKPRATWDAATEPAPAGYSHARSTCAAMRTLHRVHAVPFVSPLAAVLGAPLHAGGRGRGSVSLGVAHTEPLAAAVPCGPRPRLLPLAGRAAPAGAANVERGAGAAAPVPPGAGNPIGTHLAAPLPAAPGAASIALGSAPSAGAFGTAWRPGENNGCAALPTHLKPPGGRRDLAIHTSLGEHAGNGGRRHERRQGARTDTHPWGGGGGSQPRPHPPPPSRGLADIFGDISRRLTAAQAGSSATGEGIVPPKGGGRSRGHRSTPTPIPRGRGGAQGAEAAASAAQMELGQPPPPGPCRGKQGSFSPPPPHRKGH